MGSTKFSISYVNQEMAKYYNVKERILGYDSHGHTGKLEPHIHLPFKKKGYVSLDKSTMTLKPNQFRVILKIFLEIHSALLNRYEQDIKNGK